MGGSQLISDFRWYGSDQSLYYDRYELKTEEADDPWSGLVNLIDIINNSTSISESLPQVFNVNSFYKAIGTDILFANLDSYIDGGRNFYVYKNFVTGKFEWIVWDVGLSFGAYGGGGMGGSSNSSSLSVTYVTSAISRPLAGKVFNDATLKSEYLQSLCYLFNTYFNSERIFAQIDSIANTIRPYVTADSRKQYTTQQFETNINSDITLGGGQGGGNKPGLKSFITARITSVQNQLVSLGVSCLLDIEPGDLVINEFMSSNDSIPDPAGEAEDWIELYNNTSEDLDISGTYLSDDFNNPNEWQFPENTVVAANGYLIIWADEDDDQEGLHANFKLSSTDGEEIILSNLDLTVIDSVSFESQALNLSMSRIPNGTGSFVQSNPTFNRENSNTTSVEESTAEIPGTFTLKQNYPNPFNPTTTINFTVDKTRRTTLRVYNVLGQLIETLYEGYADPGNLYSIKFDASKLNSGGYFYRLESEENVETKRMVLIK
ncbi:MAG: hypothetical protein A2000_06465 [Ignavibacteria bacterium GWB2_36_8]|nr:MAG: hypothetical protein A2000_06465 [Ignavibacteria bacterium GWB2_36_8]